MRICILTPRFPFPENGGDVLRINNIARYLKSKGHELILVSFCEDMKTGMEENAAQLYDHVYRCRRNRFASAVYSFLFLIAGRPIQCGYYHSSRYSRLLKRVVREHEPDIYISHLLRMAPYLENIGKTDSSIVEMTDALSKTYGLASKAKGSIVKRIVYAIERKLIEKYEQRVIKVFPKVVLVSSEDISLLAGGTAGSLCLHSNGVETGRRPSAEYDSNKICFVGNMRTLQNQDAVLFFVKDVFPKILNVNPDAKFYIVGAEPPQAIRSLASERIVVTGFVDDLSAFISDACLAIAPVRIAAGIQNKILVAMGNGIPVVLTSLISKAMPELHDGENCIIRDDAGGMAEACLNLMTDAERRRHVAESGYEMVLGHYTWNSKLSGYEHIS